jgi:hypothetical protein
MANSGLPIALVEPATCVIRVRGVLSPDWSVRLAGMRIMTTRSGNRAVTELVGRLADQAALHGVLSALYELGLPLISVDCAAIEAPPSKSAADHPTSP